VSAAHATGESLFAHRGYVLLWFTRLAGVTASQMLMVAVAWQMYDLTARPGTWAWWGCCSSRRRWCWRCRRAT